MALRLLSIRQANMAPNPAVERDGQKLLFWFPPLRLGRPSLLR
jgi:hypothetical protein